MSLQNPQPKRMSAVVGRIQAYQTKVASGESQVPEKDPNCQGHVAIPKGAGDDMTKLNLPADARKENAAAPSQLTDKDTHPAGVGEGQVPATKPGDPKDEAATKPNDPLSKIAGAVNRIQTLRKSASAPAAAPAAPVAKQAGEGKTNDAVAGDIQLTPEFHFKLASAILDEEEGIAFAEKILAKKAGQAMAAQMIANAREAQAKFEALGAAYEEQLNKEAAAQQAGLQAAEEMFKNATAEQREQIVKFATVHERNLSRIADPLMKAAYMQGADDAAAMMDTPEGQEPQLPGGGEGPASIEEIGQILMQLVQSGEISEQDAAQVLQELQAAEQGGEGAEAGAHAEPDSDNLPPGAAPETPEEKQASEFIAGLIKK